MNAGTLAKRPAVTTRETASLQAVAREMAENEIGFVVIVDEGGGLIGVATDRDLVVRGLVRGLAGGAEVSEVMSRDVVSVDEDAEPLDVARQMGNRQCRRVPVTNPDGVVVGVVSTDDLLAAESDELEQIVRAIR